MSITYSIKSGDRFIIEVKTPVMGDDFKREGLLWTVQGVDVVPTRFAETDLVKFVKVPDNVSNEDSPTFAAGFQAGVDKVWGIMSEIQQLSLTEIVEVFGTATIDKILALGYEEIHAKIANYHETKTRIGDELRIVTKTLPTSAEIVGIYLGNDGHWTYVITEEDTMPTPIKVDDIIAVTKTGRRAIVCAEGGVPNKAEKR